MTGGAAWSLARGWGLVDRPEAGEHGGVLYLGALTGGVIHVIVGPAAVVCRAALAGGGPEQIVEATAEVLGVRTGDVDAAVVDEVVGDLVRLGALTGPCRGGPPR